MARMRARSGLWQQSFDGFAVADESLILDSDPMRSPAGTRFRLFPQPPFLDHYRTPVTVRVSPPAGSVGPGPADDRMYVVVPVGKRRPYGIAVGPYGSPFLYLPAWGGPTEAPAVPDLYGHFDRIAVDAPEFEAAHVYGCVRWVLDIWERYLGGPIRWHFRRDFDALEISLFPRFDNAYAGYGFLEIGADLAQIRPRSFGLNFDIVAHELGHLIIYSLLGVPDAGEALGEYQGFHESSADLVALIAAAHFEPVLDELFANTRGNLYALNELNRFAELSEQTQIRLASNFVKLSAFRDGWSDEHDLSLPLTGAVFDIFCDIYHRLLIARDLIGAPLIRLVAAERQYGENEGRIQAGFDLAYARHPQAFRTSLCDARQYVGRYLAETWQRLAADRFGYAQVARTMLAVDRDLGDGRFHDAIDGSFRWREFDTVRIGPRLTGPSYGSHLRSARTVLPDDARSLSRMSYRERWEIARAR